MVKKKKSGAETPLSPQPLPNRGLSNEPHEDPAHPRASGPSSWIAMPELECPALLSGAEIVHVLNPNLSTPQSWLGGVRLPSTVGGLPLSLSCFSHPSQISPRLPLQ